MKYAFNSDTYVHILRLIYYRTYNISIKCIYLNFFYNYYYNLVENFELLDEESLLGSSGKSCVANFQLLWKSFRQQREVLRCKFRVTMKVFSAAAGSQALKTSSYYESLLGNSGKSCVANFDSWRLSNFDSPWRESSRRQRDGLCWKDRIEHRDYYYYFYHY